MSAVMYFFNFCMLSRIFYKGLFRTIMIIKVF